MLTPIGVKIVPWVGSVCTFHILSLKPHDKLIMGNLSRYDISK